MLGRAQQPGDTLEKRAPGGGHRQRGCVGAQPLQLRQGARVAGRVPTRRHREVVTTVLALHAHAVRYPPDGRVVEEQRLGGGLQQVNQVVAAADVRQLVGQDQLELRRREPGEGAAGQQDHGPQPADHRGHLHERRLVEGEGRPNPQGAHQAGQGRLDRGRHRRPARAPHPLHESPAAEGAQGQDDDAHAPEPHQAGEPRLDAAPQLEKLESRRLQYRGSHRGDGGEAARSRPLPHRPHGGSRGLVRLHLPLDGPERHHGQQQHGQEDCGGEQVAHLGRGPPQQEVQARQQGRHGRSLPDEVQQAPAKGADHSLPPSSRSSISRIRASSSRDVFRAESACITSLVAEPPKARSNRSRTSRRCVWSSCTPAA